MRRFLWVAVIFSAAVIIFSSAVLWVGMEQRQAAETPDSDVMYGFDAGDSNVFYEIFVRSFHDSDGDGIGDLNGITAKLDYLQALGVSGIWLMPVNPSPSYHGYDVTDYYDINPDYGTMDDFERLLAEAHQRNIRIVMDLVVNHTSSEHPWFLESARDADSAKRDWYIWAEEQINTNGVSAIGGKAWHKRISGHYLGIFWDGMPDLNLDHPEVRQELVRIGQFWLEKGVDGFRLDAAKHIYEDLPGDGERKDVADRNVAWWQEFRRGMNEVNPDAYLVGEVWDAASVIGPYLDQALNAAFNFDLAGQLLAMAGSEKAADIGFTVGRIHDYYATVSGGAFEDAVFLSNHDQNRVMSQLRGNVEHAKMAASLLLTMPGKPYIYYGEEIGMEGVKPDERIRLPLSWTEVEEQLGDDSSLLARYRTLIRWRKLEPILALGGIRSYESGNAAVASFLRVMGEEKVTVLHNLSGQPQTVTLALDRENMDEPGLLFSTGDDAELSDGIVTIPAYHTVVIK